MSEEIVSADVRTAPWSEGATVVVDVANLCHELAHDANTLLQRLHEREERPGPAPRIGPTAVMGSVGRIVDVLEHHGVRTGRLLLALALEEFPPVEGGWRAVTRGWLAAGRRHRLARIEEDRRCLARTREYLADRGVEVQGLRGARSRLGEHCVDELAVLSAAHASWTRPDRDVFVITWDADVAVAPRLAGEGRILLARTMDKDARDALSARLQRHQADGGSTRLPPYVSLLRQSLRAILAPQDLPEGPLRDAVGELHQAPAPTVELARVDGSLVLRDAWNPMTRLSSDLDAPHDRSWVERRRDAIAGAADRLGAVAIVDPFGLLASANRAGLPGRVPTADSVAEALGEVTPPGLLAQLAVIPDVLDGDIAHAGVPGKVDRRIVVAPVHHALTARVRRDLQRLDSEMEAAIDTYVDDGLEQTISTTSVFSRDALMKVGQNPATLAEKESGVLLAADLLWTLMETQLPVILLSDRSDVVVALDHIHGLIGADRTLEERVLRVGLHADPFSGEGIAVERSDSLSRWSTLLLTGRQLAILLRLDVEHPPDPRSGPTITDAIAYDPLSGMFDVLDVDGERLASTTLREMVQLPLADYGITADPESINGATAEQARSGLGRELRLHLDLRTPLPRPVLMTPGERPGLVPARSLSARVVGHGQASIRVQPSGAAGSDTTLNVPLGATGMRPATGSTVEIVVQDDGSTCIVAAPDLEALATTSGAPRLARVTEQPAILLLAAGPDGGEEANGGEDAPGGEDGDGAGELVRSLTLHGPFPAPRPGDVVLTTWLEPGLVQIVSTPLAADGPWAGRARD